MALNKAKTLTEKINSLELAVNTLKRQVANLEDAERSTIPIKQYDTIIGSVYCDDAMDPIEDHSNAIRIKKYTMKNGDTITQDMLMDESIRGELEIWAADHSNFTLSYPNYENWILLENIKYFKAMYTGVTYQNSDSPCFYIETNGGVEYLKTTTNGNPGTPFTLTFHCTITEFMTEADIDAVTKLYVRFTPAS